MLRVIPATQAKNNFGEIIKRVYEEDECQIIERSGIPIAAIVSMSDLERLYPEKFKELPRLAMSARRQRAWQRLTRVLDEVQQGSEGLSEEEVDVDVDRAVGEVRHSKKEK
jgi:prevent-host-death family protein